MILEPRSHQAHPPNEAFLPENVRYQPYCASGWGTVGLAGKAMAGISGYSEFSEQLGNGKLRAIGISARRSIYGIPAIRDQGVDIEMANWRGVFTGQAVTATRRAEMVEAVRRATGDVTWQQILKQTIGSALGSRVRAWTASSTLT